MRTIVRAFETVTACLATLVAGMSLTLPVNFAWTRSASALQLDLLAHNVPRAIAAGAIVALTVAVFATTVNHGLAAWGSASCGAALLLVTHLVGHDGPGASLPTLNFLDAMAGGVLLGGTGAAVLHGRAQVFGWTVGGLGSVVVGAALPVPHADDLGSPIQPGQWPAVDSPPSVLIAVVLAFVALGTLINRHRTQVERRAIELPMAPIVAGLVYVVVVLFCVEWLTHRFVDTPHIAVSAAATVVAGLLAALLLPRRDGALVLLAVALSAVAGAILPSSLPGWSAAPLLVLLAAGTVAGLRRPGPLAALAVLGALAIYAALTHDGSGHDRVRPVVCGVVLAVAAGYGFGSISPRYNPTRVLGLAITFMPSVVPALRDRVGRGHISSVTEDDGRWYVCQAPTASSTAPYWTALAIAVGCGAGLLILRRLRPATVAQPEREPTDDIVS